MYSSASGHRGQSLPLKAYATMPFPRPNPRTGGSGGLETDPLATATKRATPRRSSKSASVAVNDLIGNFESSLSLGQSENKQLDDAPRRRGRKPAEPMVYSSANPPFTQDAIRQFMVKTMLPKLLKSMAATGADPYSKRAPSNKSLAWRQACQEFGYLKKGVRNTLPRTSDPAYAQIRQRADQLYAAMQSQPQSQSQSGGSSSVAVVGADGAIVTRGQLPVGFVESMDRSSWSLYADPDPAFIDELYALTVSRTGIDLFNMGDRPREVLKRLFKVVAKKRAARSAVAVQ